MWPNLYFFQKLKILETKGSCNWFIVPWKIWALKFCRLTILYFVSTFNNSWAHVGNIFSSLVCNFTCHWRSGGSLKCLNQTFLPLQIHNQFSYSQSIGEKYYHQLFLKAQQYSCRKLSGNIYISNVDSFQVLQSSVKNRDMKNVLIPAAITLPWNAQWTFLQTFKDQFTLSIKIVTALLHVCNV